MAERKYGKHILREPYKKVFQLESLSAHDNELNAGFIVAYQPVHEPFIMVKDTHKHDFQQFLVFAGGNPLNVREFDAEIELSLGEEGEIYTIDTPSIVSIPPGLYHCPLNFKKVNKPIVFMEMMLTGEYERTHTDGTRGFATGQQPK